MALLPSAAAWPATGGPVTVTDLGPASEVTSTGVAERIGDRIYTATSGVSPVQVGAFDLETHVIEEKYSLPTGAGVWAMAHVGTDLYVGTYTPGHLYRIDTVTGTVRQVADFGDFIWAIAASPDGRIFAGTYPDAGVHEYDPASGETKSYGSAVAGEQYVRSIAASETTVYAGVGASAHLIAIDRGTGAKVDVLPEEYANRTFVATLDLSGNTLAAGLSATGTLLLFDTTTMAKPTEVQAPAGDKYITAITVDGTTGDTYLGTRPSGTLFRYEKSSGELRELGSPYDGAYFNRIFVAGDAVLASLTSSIMEYHPDTGFTGHDLAQAGLPPAPELPMQLAATEDHVLVSGKAGVQVHDLGTGTSTRPFLPGEAKTISPVGDTVYLGVYTLARLFTMAPDGSALRQVDTVGHEQTRPTDAVYDERSGRLLLTTEPEYGEYEGTLSIYDVKARDFAVYRGVVPDQSVASVTVRDDVAYLGSHTRNSLGTEPIVDDATLSAFDLSGRKVLWEVTPVVGADRIGDLVAFRGRVYGTTNNGKLFEFDPASGTATATVTLGSGQSVLTLARDRLYGTDGDRVFQVVPSAQGAPAVHTVVDGLDAEVYSVPMLAASPDGSALYTLRGRDLVRISGLRGQ
jgi:hypothetical protein